jgi:hypothetical protein
VILKLAFWLAHFLLISFLAYMSLDFFRSGRRSLDLAIYVFLWIFYTTSSLFAFGLAGWLYGRTLGLFSLLGILLILAVKPTRTKFIQFFSSFSPLLAEIGSWWKALPRWLRWLTGFSSILVVLRFAFLIWALPPFVWDSLTYHLTNVGQWIHDGRIGLFTTSTARIYSPANYEVLATWFAVFLHHDVVIEASGLPAYVLGGLSVYALVRGLGGQQYASTIAVVAYLSAPAFLFSVTNTKNDPYVAAMYLLCYAIVVQVFLRRDTSPGIKPWGLLVVFICAALYALGTKTYMVHISAGLGLFAILVFLPQRDRFSTRRLLARSGLGTSGVNSGSRWMFLLLLGMAAFLGSYWYVRNWVRTGTPFYPYSVRIEGTTVLESEGNTFDLSPENFIYNLTAFGSKFGDKQYRIVPDLSNTTGWGWVVYGMGLVATAWGLGQKKEFRLLFLGFLASFLVIAISLPRSPWNMRYVIWLPAIFSIGLGLFFEFTDQWPKRSRSVLIGLFLFCLGMNGVMSLDYNLIPIDAFRSMLSIPTLERDAGKLHLQVPVEYQSVYDYVPKEAVLGYSLHENGFVYPLLRADLSQDIVYIQIKRDATCAEIATEMRFNNTRYLFVAPVLSEDYVIQTLEACARAGDIIRERAPGLYIVKSDG